MLFRSQFTCPTVECTATPKDFVARCTEGYCQVAEAMKQPAHTYPKLFPQAPDANLTCQVDADCVATPLQDGSCCPDTCAATLHVFNVEAHAKIAAHREASCPTGQGECDTSHSCQPLSYDQVPRCTDGRCSIQKIDHIIPDIVTPGGKTKAGKTKLQR